MVPLSGPLPCLRSGVWAPWVSSRVYYSYLMQHSKGTKYPPQRRELKSGSERMESRHPPPAMLKPDDLKSPSNLTVTSLL